MKQEKHAPDPFLKGWWARIAFGLWMLFILAAACGWLAELLEHAS